MATFFADLIATLFERRWERLSDSRSDSGAATERLEALLSGEGEVSGMRLAREILSQYRAMDDAAKRVFFSYLADRLDLDPDRLHAAVEAYRTERNAETLGRLSRAAEPRRQELLRRLNQAPGATARLVRMRHDLLRLLSQAPELGVIDTDFRHLFSSWFNRGFLVLRQIDWTTPANILEKIIEYEAVHAINDWQELRRRMLPRDRRCFAFFHPAMPEDPLIFVEVALCRGIPGSVQHLLSEDREALDESEVDTAVFYSISNCQEGLKGISFGNLLIKQVVEELARDVPGLETFVTLSPVPGLNRWIKAASPERPALAALLAQAEGCDHQALAANHNLLRQLCAEYLMLAKRPDGLPDDPVARFHLANGASLHEIHAMADTSVNGWRQSSTVMVNYLYDLPSVSRNSERYAAAAHVIASRQVEQLLPKDRKRRRG